MPLKTDAYQWIEVRGWIEAAFNKSHPIVEYIDEQAQCLQPNGADNAA